MPIFNIVLIVFGVTFATTLIVLLLFFKKLYTLLFFDLKIVYKIILSFLVVSVLPIIILGLLVFNSARQIMINNEFKSMTALVEQKKENIEIYLTQMENELRLSQNFFILKESIPVFVENIDNQESPELQEALLAVDEHLVPMVEYYNLIDALLFDLDGNLVYTTGIAHGKEEIGGSLGDPFDDIIDDATQRIVFSEIYKSDYAKSGYEMIYAAPITSADGESTVGVIAFSIDLTPIYDLLADTRGLGNTGEMLLVRYLGPQDNSYGSYCCSDVAESVVFLNPLRHNPESALSFTIDFDSDRSKSAQLVAKGNEGSGISYDYRGKEVISVWRYIPSQDWGFVAKVDQEEALSEISLLARNVVLMVIALIALLFPVALFAAKVQLFRVSRLIEALKMDSGDSRDRLEKLPGYQGKDEIGQMASQFNVLVGQVETSRAQLTEKVEELGKFREVTVGRELKMVELKKKLAKLENKDKDE